MPTHERDAAMAAADRIAALDDASSDDDDAREFATEVGPSYVDLFAYLGDGDVHEGCRLWREENDPRVWVDRVVDLVMEDVSDGLYGLGY